MKLPKKIRIMPLDYEILLMDEEEKRQGKYLGQCKNNEAKITIDERYNSQVQANTLLHEVLHAVSHHMGKFDLTNEQEEKVVEGMATGLCVVMRDNPKLFPLIQKALK